MCILNHSWTLLIGPTFSANVYGVVNGPKGVMLFVITVNHSCLWALAKKHIKAECAKTIF